MIEYIFNKRWKNDCSVIWIFFILFGTLFYELHPLIYEYLCFFFLLFHCLPFCFYATGRTEATNQFSNTPFIISCTSNIIFFIHYSFEMINQFFSSSGFLSKSLTYLSTSLSLNFLTLRFCLKGSNHYFLQYSGLFALYFFSLLFILFHVFQILTCCLLLRYSFLVSIVFFIYLWMIDELPFVLRSPSQFAGGFFHPYGLFCI